MRINDLLLVYGTLRQGQSNDISKWKVSGTDQPAVEFIGFDAIDGVMFDCGWYPGVQQADDFGASGNDQTIFGEVFKIVGAGIVDRLDMYEGYPSLYDRVQVNTMSGQKVWVYTFADAEHRFPLVEGGDWADYMIEQRAAEIARNKMEMRNSEVERIDVC